jgi:hypothetical protein
VVQPHVSSRIYLRTTPTPVVRWSRLRAAASQRTGRRRSTRAFWSWPRGATFRFVGPVGSVFVITVRADWFRIRERQTLGVIRNQAPRAGSNTCFRPDRLSTLVLWQAFTL